MKVIHIRDSDKNTIYGGRVGGRNPEDTPIGKKGWLGNPILLNDRPKGSTIPEYREYLWKRVNEDAEFREALKELAGKTVACYCKPGPCHLDQIKAWLDAGCPLKEED